MNPFSFKNHSNPNQSQIPNNFYSIHHQNRDLTKNEINDWKKIITNKLMERINSARKERMNKIFEKKFEFIEEIKTLNLTDDINSINEFISKIWDLFQNNYDEFQNENFGKKVNCNLSICPICNNPVIAIKDKVFCFNSCFDFSIPTKCFSENFTLENLMDKYLETFRNHIECNSDIIPIIADECFVYLGCMKCFEKEINNIFN